MRTLVFEVSGEYGLFKKPYSPMSPVSYPLPPPPAVLGMLGAILGYGKDEYMQRLGWESTRVAIGLCKPLQVFRAALNLMQTKGGSKFAFTSNDEHIQIPFQFLRNPHFRIYIAGLSEAITNELYAYLSSGRSAYTVCLGLASCLAELQWIGEWEAQALPSGDYIAQTAIPLRNGISVYYDNSRYYHRVRIPASMDHERVVHNYQEIVLAEDGAPIRGTTTQGECYAVGTDTVMFL